MNETKPIKTKQKKVVSRNVAIALGTICIILLAGLGGAMGYYTAQVNDKDSTYNDYVSSHSHNNTEFTEYVSTHSHTDSDYITLSLYATDLQSQINSLEASNLTRISLGESDNRPANGTPYLHIVSVIVNLGTKTAYSCNLHVILYQGNTIAKDTYVLLGTIFGQTGISTTDDVQYSGSALTAWTITTE
jgi:hypothetical protein